MKRISQQVSEVTSVISKTRLKQSNATVQTNSLNNAEELPYSSWRNFQIQMDQKTTQLYLRTYIATNNRTKYRVIFKQSELINPLK